MSDLYEVKKIPGKGFLGCFALKDIKEGTMLYLAESENSLDEFKMSGRYEVRKIEGKGYGCFPLKDIKKGALLHVINSNTTHDGPPVTSDEFKMSDLYEVRKIEGKGYGCFALKDIKKGTLILQEFQKFVNKPAGDDERIPETPDKCREFALNILSFFDELSQSEKDEYLKLWNKFDGKQPHTQLMQDNLNFYRQFVEKTFVGIDDVRKNMTIIGIYLTNNCGKGILIKISQFNHSCKSNAFCEQHTPLAGRLIAYKNIKAGQEITWSRFGAFGSFFYMLNRTMRQGELHRHSA